MLTDLFAKAEKIVVVSHSNPDGDAVGSAFAIQHLLVNLKKEAVCILPNRFPDYLNYLQPAGDVLFITENKKLCQEKFASADLIVCVDFNNSKRIGISSDMLLKSKAAKILIDHHETSELETFDLCFSTIHTSSTAELIFWILSKLYKKKEFLTKPVAECIYTGICTDTGSFSYSSNFVSTYKAVVALIEAGVDTEALHLSIYNNYSEKRLRLLGHCLKDKLKILPEIGVAYIYLTMQELDEFGFQEGDTEGIVNYTLTIEGVNVGVMLTQQKDKTRISFRSKHDFDVNIFAKKYFGGGGHKKASGATSFKSFNQLLPFLEESLTTELKK